ncbi:CD4-1 molecule [Danio aesculapii]|uniref:CD4-1 molecule n=1 Tax=Danio aesculapii TaxID=1142201 RepID=UPI0024BFEDDD|nr:CD4-1 molecule [Danio aesculapii]
MLGLILIPLFITVLKAQENHEVIYAQVGGTVTLPREKIEQTKNKNIKTQDIYVNWYNGSEDSPTINRNPQSNINRGKETNTRFSLSADFSLQISPVQESDFVIWRCEQHVLAGTYKNTYKLYKVSITKVPALLVGHALSMRIKKADSSVNPSVTWILPRNEGCEEKRNFRDISVYVSNVSMCHNGVWTCQLKYGNKKTEATTTVSVIDLAPSPADPVYTSFPPSSTVSIPCSLSSAIPWSVLNEIGLQGGSWSFTPLSEPRSPSSLLTLNVGSVVRWDVSDGANFTDGKRDITNHNLSIQNLRVSETIRGVYNCSLKFNNKTISRKVKVEVLKVSVSGGSKVFEGTRVNVTCSLGHMETTGLEVKWKCPSNCPPFNHKSPPHLSVLSFPNIRMKDKGHVECELWKNGQKLTSAQLYLKVEKAPVDIWLCIAIGSGVVVFILLVAIAIICVRRHKQMMMYRRRKTRFCCCNNNKPPKGFYKT